MKYLEKEKRVMIILLLNVLISCTFKFWLKTRYCTPLGLYPAFIGNDDVVDGRGLSPFMLPVGPNRPFTDGLLITDYIFEKLFAFKGLEEFFFPFPI